MAWPDRRAFAFVLAGDWDRVHVERPIIERTIHQLFIEGRPHAETVQFAHLLGVLERGTDEWNHRCKSLADIHAYFDRLVAAYEAIRPDGYRTQEELGGRPGDEIKLFVDRNGELLIGNGDNHRLHMVQALGVQAVPVLVMGVHVRWARRCYDRWGAPLEAAIGAGLERLAADVTPSRAGGARATRG